MFDREQAKAAQIKYCKEKKLPRFVPDDGFCWKCGMNVYDGPKGYSVEEAGSTLITGCPFCFRTYCD